MAVMPLWMLGTLFCIFVHARIITYDIRLFDMMCLYLPSTRTPTAAPTPTAAAAATLMHFTVS